jgi:uncharacterized membrane protein
MAKGKTAPAVPEYVDKTFGRINDSGSRSETVARIVAFSDGVVAIIITIMVLELKTPFLEGNIHGAFDFSFLAQTGPKFLAYVISFAFVATMWFAHVSVMRGLNYSSPSLLWLNAFYLFFMSLIPWTTAFVGEHPLLPQAVAMWGLTLTLALFWGAIPLTFHIHKLDSRIPAWAKRRNVFTTALIALSVPLAFVSVYLAWFVIITLPSFYGLSNKFQKRIFSSKSERLAGV